MTRGVSFSDGTWNKYPIWPTQYTVVHTEKSFRNLIKSTWNQIAFTIFRLIWTQTDVRLDPNQSVHGKYNLISGWFNKIWKRYLCVACSLEYGVSPFGESYKLHNSLRYWPVDTLLLDVLSQNEEKNEFKFFIHTEKSCWIILKSDCIYYWNLTCIYHSFKMLIAFGLFYQVSEKNTLLDVLSQNKKKTSSNCAYTTRKNLFWILLNLTEIRLHLPIFDWFGKC